MLQAAGGGSGGGASPATGGGGGDVARSLAGQVKALRARVEELLERARDAEVTFFFWRCVYGLFIFYFLFF